MKDDKKVILKVLVGSRAHGLADKDSDYDYRAVYVIPTEKLLSLGFRYKGNDWVEGDEDNTAYELGHFLHLATKCNPSILEVFKAPVEYNTEEGERLRYLFKNIWYPEGVFEAFRGYSHNQRKKFLDKKDNRQNKFAVAYLRTLVQLYDLLTKEDFSTDLTKSKYYNTLKKWKKGDFTTGEVIDTCENLIDKCGIALPKCKHKANLDIVNNVLLEIRRRNWDG